MIEINPEPISFNDFKKILAEVLVIEEDRLTPETSFNDELYVDSVRWLEIAIMIEDLGVEMPTDSFWEIQTVGDAYQSYNHYLNMKS